MGVAVGTAGLCCLEKAAAESAVGMTVEVAAGMAVRKGCSGRMVGVGPVRSCCSGRMAVETAVRVAMSYCSGRTAVEMAVGAARLHCLGKLAHPHSSALAL